MRQSFEGARGFEVADSVREVVASGLCIGCGLCEAITAGRVKMTMTANGSLRPLPVDCFSAEEEALILSACPGAVVQARAENGPEADLIWGGYSAMHFAWAGDADVRFRGSTGGVLTALACHLLRTAQVQFVLHVGADPDRPMRTRWVHSQTCADVIRNAGSRYGPTAPLAGLVKALERNVPFAVVAKPCDLSAVERLAQADERVNRLCKVRLALVCGGQSRLTKSLEFLREYGIAESELTVFRYRGYGNPGRTRAETVDGHAFEKTYAELWEDEAGWEIETRCKLCPDALGEAADIVAADVWPGCNPIGEDAGFNGIVIRTAAGANLIRSAVSAGDLVLGDRISPRQFDSFQPHQLRKKQAFLARLAGLKGAGHPGLAAIGLRMDEIARTADPEFLEGEVCGALRRAEQGKFSERDVEPMEDR